MIKICQSEPVEDGLGLQRKFQNLAANMLKFKRILNFKFKDEQA